MKRGKEEDEKVVGPMFPRLHVNDQEKGGPRAPPRNKMALYEQFSVPSSQRFINNTRLLPQSSSSQQGPGLERSYVFPVHSPSQAPTRRESYISHQSDRSSQNTSLVQLERRKSVDEDDFMVPVYVQLRNGSNDRTLKSFNGRNLTPMGSGNFGCSVAAENNGDTGTKQIGSQLVDIRKDVRKESEGSQSNDNENGDGLPESLRATDKENPFVPRGHFSTENQTSPQEADNDTEGHDTRISSPIQEGNSDTSDNNSKISTVENLSSSKVSPDDAVGILGQKHFWKARREIANQQRIFAVQVFELHRLIKVQQLIAGSPDLMIEDAAFIGKIPVKGSTTKNLTVEVIVEPKQLNRKRKDDSQNPPNNTMEHSAENAVGRTSLSSPKNGDHLPNYTPFLGNPHPASIIASDDRTGPLGFNPSPVHQWLVPVMSPSEGLVYKPYPGPGFTGPMCGGSGPFAPIPLSGTFMNPVYGSHAYFPPYGMPAMNQEVSGSADEQANNHFAAPQGSHVQNGHSPLDEANSNTRNQTSSNLPARRNGSVSRVKKFHAYKKSELQGSSASSPDKSAQVTRTEKIAEGRDAQHSPLVTAPVVQKIRVIKVVPHNRRSATESAARIFQSIQEERKQYD